MSRAYESILQRSLYKKSAKGYTRVKVGICDFYREGWYLVHVDKGCTSIDWVVHPEKAEVLAAMRLAKDAMVRSLSEAGKLTPNQALASKKAQRLWKELSEELDRPLSLQGISYNDLVDAGMKVLQA
jgi:hypothetical protein